jgi:hypothetical protein
MRTIKLFVVVIFAAFSMCIHAQTFREVKTWKFTLPHGSLAIDLRSYSDGWASLGISPYDQIPEAPINEQIEPLKQVLAEMPSLGVNPNRLAIIETHLWAKDVQQKLAYACADSAAWSASMKDNEKGKERLVTELLNQSGAFELYNEAFKQYGIQVHVTEAENVGFMHFSQVPPRDSRDRAKAKMLVPADAMLGMRFSRIEKKD